MLGERQDGGLYFPDSETVPESKLHLELRTLLYQVLKLAFADQALIGSDQFLYWDPTDPRHCLSPDVCARMGAPDELFRSWKVWERGAPHVAVEVISDTDGSWSEKLDRYRRSGVAELVRFDPEAKRSALLRIWDSVDGDLVERSLESTGNQSRWLPGYWLVVEDADLGPTLRLSRDAEGTDLYPTPTEAAEARVRELEAELRRRG